MVTITYRLSLNYFSYFTQHTKNSRSTRTHHNDFGGLRLKNSVGVIDSIRDIA